MKLILTSNRIELLKVKLKIGLNHSRTFKRTVLFNPNLTDGGRLCRLMRVTFENGQSHVSLAYK